MNEIEAAGGLIVDDITNPRQILLIHRPGYDDWTFPKGKLDPGESAEAAALREVAEETGLRCRIITKLASSNYVYRTRSRGLERPKVVHYFLMQRVSGEITVPPDEVDEADWFTINDAARKLTYSQDRELLSLLPPPPTIA